MGRDDAEAELVAKQRFTGLAYALDVNEYQALENWATNAFDPKPPFDFYSDANVSAAGAAQSAITGRTAKMGDDGDLAAWVRQVSARQESRQRAELLASGNLWRVSRKLNKDALTKASEDHERLRRQTMKVDSDPPADEAKSAASWSYDVALRTDEVAIRSLAIGVTGHDFERRLTNAAVRFITERRCLQIYIAALISSIESIPTYRNAYSQFELDKLAELTESFAEMGDGADLVFDSLTRLDLMNKRIALNTLRGEFSVILKPDRSGKHFTGITPDIDGIDLTLFRYARLALLGDGLIANCTLEGPVGGSANAGSILPVALMNKGEPTCVNAFWNIAIEGLWQIHCETPPSKTAHPSVLLTIGYEQLKFDGSEIVKRSLRKRI